jgi:hypothetical protein
VNVKNPDSAQEEIIDRIVQAVAELPDRTSPDDWPEAMLVTADELRSIVSEHGYRVIGSGYESGFDAGYAKGYADSYEIDDPRVERIEAGLRALYDATLGEYSRDDLIVLDALQAARDFAVRLVRREAHIQQLINERDGLCPTCGGALLGSFPLCSGCQLVSALKEGE